MYLSMKISLPALGFFCGIAVLGGCASTRAPSAGADKQSVAESAAVASALQQIKTSNVDYKINAADLVQVTVFAQKDLDREARVSQNGTISLPLVGTVKLGGLGVIEAEALLAEKLKDYLVNPQITLFIKEYGNKKIFVLGEVKKPGSVDLPTEAKLTVVEAITLSGGFTPIAAPNRTRVMRMVGGKSQTFTVEITAITHHGQKQKDISLEPNDVIYVPQSYF